MENPETFSDMIDWGEGNVPMELCVDCGAHVLNNKPLVHYPSCIPGESKRWEEIYKQEKEKEQ